MGPFLIEPEAVWGFGPRLFLASLPGAPRVWVPRTQRRVCLFNSSHTPLRYKCSQPGTRPA